MFSSGEKPASTSGDEPVVLVKVPANSQFGRGDSWHNLAIVNEGPAGLFRIDGDYGDDWCYLPTGRTLLENLHLQNVSISMKRFPGGKDMNGVFAMVW